MSATLSPGTSIFSAAAALQSLAFGTSVMVASLASATRQAGPFAIDDPQAAAAAASLQSSLPWSDADASRAQAAWLGAGGSGAGCFVGVDLFSLATAGAAPNCSKAAGDRSLPAFNFRVAELNATPSNFSGLLATTFASQEGVRLLADLWVLPSALLLAGNDSGAAWALQRGVPTGPRTFFVSNGAGDTRPGMGGALPPSALASALVGLDVTVRRATWKLRGTPSAVLLQDAAGAHQTTAYSASRPHVITLAGGPSLSALLPGGSLLSGYVYSATVALELSVGLAYSFDNAASGVAPPGSDVAFPLPLAPLLAAGVAGTARSRRRLQPDANASATPTPTSSWAAASFPSAPVSNSSSVAATASLSSIAFTANSTSSSSLPASTANETAASLASSSVFATATASASWRSSRTASATATATASRSAARPSASATMSAQPTPAAISYAGAGPRYLVVPATPLRAAILYLLVPPYGGSISVSPSNGTAITTTFKLSTFGWSGDNLAAAKGAPPLAAAVDWLCASAPLPAGAVVVVSEAGGALRASAADALAAAGRLGAAVAGSLADASAVDAGTSASPALMAPAWQLAAFALGGTFAWAAPACTQDAASGCWSAPSAAVGAAAVARLQGQLNAYASSGSPILPINQTLAGIGGSALAGAQLQYIFSANISGSGVPLESNETAFFVQPESFAVQLELLSDSRGLWPGIALAAQSSSPMLSIALPVGLPQLNYSVRVFAIVQDAYGHVQYAATSVTVRPWPQAGDPAAVSGLVAKQLAGLGNFSDGISAINTVTSLGSLLQGAPSTQASAAGAVIELSLLFLPPAATGSLSLAAFVSPQAQAGIVAAFVVVLQLNASAVSVNSSQVVFASELNVSMSASPPGVRLLSGESATPAGVRVLLNIDATAIAASPVTSASAAGATSSNAALVASLDAALRAVLANGSLVSALATQGVPAALGYSGASDLGAKLAPDPSFPTAAHSPQDDLRVTNTALRASLVGVVSSAITQLAGSAAAALGSAASLVGSDLASALSDTSIAISGSTAAQAVASLSIVTSEPSELALSGQLGALSAVASLSTLMLPANVLTGAVDAANAAGGSATSAAASATNSILSAVRSIPTFPPAVSSSALGVVSNVLSSSSFSFSGSAAVLPPSSSAATVLGGVGSALRSLSAAVLRSAAVGDPPTFVANGPSASFGASVSCARRRLLRAANSSWASPPQLAGYCGQGLSVTVARVDASSDAALPVAQPMVPCFAAGSAVTTWVPLPPAPSVIVSSAVLAAAGGGMASMDITLVQSGTSFVPEAAGFSTMRFSAPNGAMGADSAPTVARPALNSTVVAANATRNATSATPTPNPSGGGAGSVQAAIVQAGLSVAASSTVSALDGGSGLDTRVLGVNMQTRAGAAVPVTAAPAPIIITIPLKDPVTGPGSVSLAAAYEAQRLNYSFVCPNDDGSVITGSRLPARVGFASGAAGGATNATELLVADVVKISYLAAAPAQSGLTFSNLYAYAVAWWDGAQPYVSVTAHVFELQADCGALMGARMLSCGPSFYGVAVNFSCPSIAVQPMCAYWSASRGTWATDGCVPINQTCDALVCACTHLTDFAGRFAALANEQNDVFAHSANLFDSPLSMLQQSPHVFAVVGMILFATFLLLFVTAHLDAEAHLRFYETLRDDEEVQFLARIEELKGHVFILDRLLDRRKEKLSVKIKSARLHAEARAAADRLGLVYVHRRADTIAAEDLLPQKAASLLSHLARLLARFRAAAWPPRDGRRVPLASSVGSGAGADTGADDEAFEVRTNPLFRHAQAAVARGGAVSGAIAKKVKSLVRADPFTSAIYSRVEQAFDDYRVTAGKMRMIAGSDASAAMDASAATAADAYSFLPAAALAKMRDKGSAEVALIENPMLAELEDMKRSASLRDIGGAPLKNLLLVEVERAKQSAGEAATRAAKVEGDGGSGGGGDNGGGTGGGGGSGGGGKPVLKRTKTAESLELLVELAAGGASSFLRVWRLRHFLWRMFWLRLWYSHLFISIFTKYDARVSRSVRLLVLTTTLLSSLFATAFFYAFRNGGPEAAAAGAAAPQLPPLELSETVVVSVLAAALTQPVTMVLAYLAEQSGESEFTYRYPFIAAELQRRKRVEKQLSKLSKTQLEEELNRIPSAAPSSSGPGEATAPGAFLRKAAAEGLISADAADAVSSGRVSTAALGGAAAQQRPPAILPPSPLSPPPPNSYGWVDAPSDCAQSCWGGPLLRACGRHPDQKAAFLASAAATEAAAAAKAAAVRAQRAEFKKKGLVFVSVAAEARAQAKKAASGANHSADKRSAHGPRGPRGPARAAGAGASTLSSTSSAGPSNAAGTGAAFASAVTANTIEAGLEHADAATAGPGASGGLALVVNAVDAEDGGDDEDADDDGGVADDVAELVEGGGEGMGDELEETLETAAGDTGDCIAAMLGLAAAFIAARALRRGVATNKAATKRSVLDELSAAGKDIAAAVKSGVSAADLLDIEAATARALRATGSGPLARVLRAMPCTAMSCALFSCAWALIMFFLYYVLLFGITCEYAYRLCRVRLPHPLARLHGSRPRPSPRPVS